MSLSPIHYIDRTTGKRCVEKVYGERAIALLYGDDWISRCIGPLLLHTLAKNSLFSRLYGWWQRRGWSRRKIAPFVKAFEIDSSEFLEPIESFPSFDAFFTRKLRPEARPITPGEEVAIIPADGRYLAFEKLNSNAEIPVKGHNFKLSELLGSNDLAQLYEGGSMVIGRLSPVDCHRFLFPVSGCPKPVRMIAGWLYSVNPAAIKRNLRTFVENKRMITVIESQHFATVTMIEVGATNVGSIHETYIDGRAYQKGQEKGYFSFGGSALVLLFQPDTIKLSADILAATKQGLELLCKMGEPLGRCSRSLAYPLSFR